MISFYSTKILHPPHQMGHLVKHKKTAQQLNILTLKINILFGGPQFMQLNYHEFQLMMYQYIMINALHVLGIKQLSCREGQFLDLKQCVNDVNELNVNGL